MDNVIGIDVGGTSIVGGRIENKTIVSEFSSDTRASEGGDITMKVLEEIIVKLITPTTRAIGIGVPSVVDREKGIVYNVQNIKGWDEVHLKEILEQEFNLPVYIDNDANCFALGEKIYGKGAQFEHFVGITLGTGVGGGIVQNNHLLKDANCGSGEFGELPYKDSILEDYCGSKFFYSYVGMSAFDAALMVAKGDDDAIKTYNEYGKHISNLVKSIMLIIDPQAIVFGGSISKSFKLFEKSMYEGLKNFPYPKSVEKIKIITSDLQNIGILGAGALCVDNLIYE